MRILLVVLTLVAAIVSVILSILPISSLAFIPAIIALILGFSAYYFSKKNGKSIHTIKLALILTILSLCLTIYKSVFNESKVGNTEELEQKELKSEEEAIEELEELDLEEIEIE